MQRQLSTDRKFYVYLWYIKDTKEVFYVGKGCGKRYKQVTSRNTYFKNMYNAHECDVMFSAENLTEAEAFMAEKLLIAYYRNCTNDRLTNISDGGEGSTGFHHTPESKAKLSIANKRKWQDEEFRAKEMEHRLHGVYQSEEFRNKISQLVQGEKNPNYGNHWSEEQKTALSILRKQNGKSAGVNNSQATKIICLETGEVFPLIKDAMKKYNVKHEKSFTVTFENPSKTAGGLHWMKYDNTLLDDKVRFRALLNALANNKFTSYICVETKQIYNQQKDLLNATSLTISQLSWRRDENGVIKHNGYTYMPISYYINSPYYQE